MRSIPYGDPTDPGVLMGPLVRESQRQRVLGYIARGVAEGAVVATGGGVPAHLPTGFYVEPTVLAGVEPHHVVAQEEIFGPVLVVLAHDGDDDAVAVANDSAYGLSGAVFGEPERARAFAGACGPGRSASTAGCSTAPTCRSAGTSRAASGGRWGGWGSRSTPRSSRWRRGRDGR